MTAAVGGEGSGTAAAPVGREGQIREAEQYDQIAELYDGHPGDYTEDIEFFVEEGRRLTRGAPAGLSGGLRPAPPRVLEIGAGTGRLTLCLAAVGVEVVALDSSPAMLRVLRRKQAALPPLAGKVEPVVADMRRFSLGRTFPLTIVPFRTFLYLLTEEDQRAALGAIRAHLAPGGRVILAFFAPPREWIARGRTPEQVAAEFPAPDGQGHVVARDWTEFDREQRRVISHITYEWRPGGERLQHELVARYVYPEEMPPLLENCGYRVVATYGDFERRPLTEQASEQIWIAERR